MANPDARVDMTTGAIGPRLFRLAWPLVLGNLLQTAYNVADIFWVGRVSPEAVAAVSLMFPFIFLLISTALGLTAATVAMISQHVGAGEDRRADRVVGQTTLLALATSTALAIGGYAFRRPLLRLVGARGQVFVEALAYIEVILAALPLTFLFFVFRAALQGAGDSRTAMWLVAVSAGVNIVIDPVFVLGWGPVPAMGTRGAAIATFLSRALAAGTGIYVLVRGDWGIALRPTDLRPDPALLRRLIDVAYPAMLDGWARSFAAVVMAALVARFGPAATAAYGVGLRLMSISWTVSGAVGQATATGVGQNLGAGTPDRAARVTRTAAGGTMAVVLAAGGLVWLFPAVAIRLFVDDAAVVAEGVSFLRITALSWPFFAGLMVVQGAFRGSGDTRIAMVLSILSRWLLRIPAAAVLAYGWMVLVPGVGPLAALDLGAPGLWWSYAFSAVASFAVGAAWFLQGGWREGTVTNTDAPAAAGPEEDDRDPDSDDDPTLPTD